MSKDKAREKAPQPPAAAKPIGVVCMRKGSKYVTSVLYGTPEGKVERSEEFDCTDSRLIASERVSEALIRSGM